MTTVCLAGQLSGYPHGGGHAWAFLNWALAFRSLGCRVIWLERISPRHTAARRMAGVEERLRPYGLDEDLAFVSRGGAPVDDPAADRYLDLEAAAEADLLINMAYGLEAETVERFSRTALLDIDPGLTQTWLASGWMSVVPHDVYLPIGETVGRPDALFPDAGIEWHRVTAGAFLDEWVPAPEAPRRPFTTVTTWAETGQWLELHGETRSNTKRDGFLPYLDLPSRTEQPLELAITFEHEEAPAELTDHGWGVVNAWEVAGTPWNYAEYVRSSRGEFSCVKPSCVWLQNAWVSDRTVCYLASGRPVVVQHTGPSDVLPDAEGMFRFRTPAEAAAQLETVAEDYDRQSKLARQLAEEHFDSRKNAARLLEVALAVTAR